MRRRAREKQKGEDRRSISKRAACCPFAVVQGAAQRKNGLCEGSARGNGNPREGQHPFRPNSNGVGDHTNTLRLQLINAGLPFHCGSNCFNGSLHHVSFCNVIPVILFIDDLVCVINPYFPVFFTKT